MSVRRIFTLVLFLAATFTTFMGAQTTPTERAAARDITRQIDELQERLQPTEKGQRLAKGSNRDRDAVKEEHRIISALYSEYLDRLREAYGSEVTTISTEQE